MTRDIQLTSSCEPLDPHKSVFTSLVSILQVGFQQGNVYCMDDILTKYHDLLTSFGIDDPAYQSHKLKKKIMQHFGSQICFRRQGNMSQSLLVFVAVFSGQAVEAVKSAPDTLRYVEMTSNDTHYWKTAY